MALNVQDRLWETTTTTGTGTVTLGGAVTGFRTFTSALSNGDTTYYCIADQGGANWEVGLGTFTTSGTTLARTTVLASSNSGALVSFPAGTKDVMGVLPASAPLLKAGGNASGDIGLVSMNGGPLAGMRNRIINGGMRVAQRGTSATVTAGTGVPTASTGYPCVDRFFVYSTGANVTAAQVAGAAQSQYRLQITGAASVTAVGIGQRIEAQNCYDLNGKACTFSVDIANSLLTSVTWTAYYATSADAFGTIGTPTKTQIATGTFTVSSTLARYTAAISVPSAATTGIEIILTVGAQTSGTWTVGDWMFEGGALATPMERRPASLETMLAQCYYRQQQVEAQAPAAGSMLYRYSFNPPMRATPTQSNVTGGTASNASVTTDAGNLTASGGYFQINATTGGGFILGRVNAYSAEVP